MVSDYYFAPFLHDFHVVLYSVVCIVKGLWLGLWEMWHSIIMVLIKEYHNSHKHSQSPLTNVCILKVLDEVDRTLEEVKHDWLDCLERAVYDKRGWPQPLTAARYNLLSFTGVVSFLLNRKTVCMWYISVHTTGFWFWLYLWQLYARLTNTQHRWRRWVTIVKGETLLQEENVSFCRFYIDPRSFHCQVG